MGKQVKPSSVFTAASHAPPAPWTPPPSSCRRTSPGLPLTLHYGEFCNYLRTHHSVIKTEMKYTIN